MADPQQPEAPIHETTTEARAASGVKTNFYALGLGLALVVALFVVIVLIAGR